MYDEITEENLRKDYYQLDMDIHEIAEKYGCHRKTISMRMDKYDMKRLPSLTKYKTNNRTYYQSGDSKFAEYQLVAIADGANPKTAFGDAHVHHINNHPFDNRPANLAVLTNEEHGIVEHSDFEIEGNKNIIYKQLKLY